MRLIAPFKAFAIADFQSEIKESHAASREQLLARGRRTGSAKKSETRPRRKRPEAQVKHFTGLIRLESLMKI